MNADAVSVRIHGKGNLGAKPKREVVAAGEQSGLLISNRLFETCCRFSATGALFSLLL
jgi:hypothetical protein